MDVLERINTKPELRNILNVAAAKHLRQKGDRRPPDAHAIYLAGGKVDELWRVLKPVVRLDKRDPENIAHVRYSLGDIASGDYTDSVRRRLVAIGCPEEMLRDLQESGRGMQGYYLQQGKKLVTVFKNFIADHEAEIG